MISTAVLIIIVILALLVLVIGLVVYCRRRKKDGEQARQSHGDTEQAAPSAPPAYDLEMAPSGAAGAETLPSYEEVAKSPDRFRNTRSSFRKISSFFSGHNAAQKI